MVLSLEEVKEELIITEELLRQAQANNAELEAKKALPKEITEDPAIYPPADVLKNSHWQDDVGDAIQFYEQYYQELKAAK